MKPEVPLMFRCSGKSVCSPGLLLLAGALLLGDAARVGGQNARSPSPGIIDLLASDREEEVAKGERYARDYRGVYVKALLEQLESKSWETKGKAAAELGIVISPWLRGKEASARLWQFARLEIPRRPVERVAGLAEAAEMRQRLQAAIEEFIREADTSASLRLPLATLEAECETLNEVADDSTMDWVLGCLQKTTHSGLPMPLFRLGESYLGLPQLAPVLMICGNASEAEFKLNEQSHLLKLAAARSALEDHWNRVRSKSVEERAADALLAWRDPLKTELSNRREPGGGQWIFMKMEPLVRFGPAALKALRRQQELEVSLDGKGVWEVLAATITGKEDPALTRALFAGTDAQSNLACEIAIGAMSQEWLPEMEELLGRKIPRMKVSTAMAVCFRGAAIPVLRRAGDSSGAVQVLESAEDGPPRGLRRYTFR